MVGLPCLDGGEEKLENVGDCVLLAGNTSLGKPGDLPAFLTRDGHVTAISAAVLFPDFPAVPTQQN